MLLNIILNKLPWIRKPFEIIILFANIIVIESDLYDLTYAWMSFLYIVERLYTYLGDSYIPLTN
jgi:hypothetical protein